MKYLRMAGLPVGIALIAVLGWVGWQLMLPGVQVKAQSASAQSTQQASGQQTGTQQSSTEATDQSAAQAKRVIRTESNVVRMDVIVTDKKGNYVRDLAAKDFRVYEDKKEQEISNFSFGEDPNAPAGTDKHYMVLFFDDSTMDVSDQPRARAAAEKFIDANAGPDRVMAVVEFGGAVRIVQNFTADANRLKQAAAGVKTSAVSPNAPPELDSSNAGIAPGLAGIAAGGLGNAEADFGAYSVLLAIRSLAKNLATVPGRKSLILFTSGFPLTPERDSELTATIDACNKANVAIYPLDVRGLLAPISRKVSPGDFYRSGRNAYASAFAPDERKNSSAGVPALLLASYRLPPSSPDPSPDPSMGQQGHPGGGGGAPRGGPGPGPGPGPGGGRGSGPGGGRGPSPNPGPGPGRGGSPGSSPRGVGSPFVNPNYTQPREIVPHIPESAATNQQVLYALAEGTGGFAIFNSNDLLSGLEKISREQGEYYLLGFSPTNSAEGSCHTLKVKVERGGTEARARSGYCNVKPTDVLAGQPVEKELESRAAQASAGNMGGSLEAPFFYTAGNEARVNLAMDVPATSVNFSKVKGKYHADINVLGIAYAADGSAGARFSDEVTLDMEKDEWKEFTKKPMHYENQFAVAPGKYRLTVVLSAGGQSFGKYQTPLVIAPYDGKTFSVSSVALSDQIIRVSDTGGELDADMLADRMPLVVHEMQLVPSGSNRFKKSDKVALYAQVYDPRLVDQNPPPVVEVGYRVVDQKTGKVVMSSGAINATQFVEKGSAMVPLALRVPLDDLQPGGSYRVELLAGEGGKVFKESNVTFETE